MSSTNTFLGLLGGAAAAVACLGWLGGAAAFSADDAYSDLGETLEQKNSLSENLCEKAGYSKAYDRWLKNYLKGDDAAAEKDWSEVLKVAHGVTDLRRLLKVTHSRLAFTDTPATEDRLNDIVCDKHILAYTEKALGPNAQVLAGICRFISGDYEHMQDYRSSSFYRKRAASVLEKVWGADDERLCAEWLDCANLLMLAHNLDEAESYADKMVALGRKKNRDACVIAGTGMKSRISKLRQRSDKSRGKQ